MYCYKYIYTCRERERDRRNIYIYIYIYIHIHIHILYPSTPASCGRTYDSDCGNKKRAASGPDPPIDGRGSPDPNPRHLVNWCS